MAKQLQIKLTPEATQKYLKLCGEQMEAEVNEFVEPTFPLIKIEMSMFENEVFMEVGNEWVELGDSAVEIISS
jgi:hypothetical protein